MIVQSQPETRLTEGYVAVVYHLTGAATPPVVARGESQLQGAAVAIQDAEPVYVPVDRRGRFAELDGLPRLYHDALLARVIEQRYKMPHSDSYECLRTMTHLLGESVPKHTAATPEEATAQAVELLERYEAMAPRLVSGGLNVVYSQIEIPAIAPAATMISNGVYVDIDMLLTIEERSAAAAACATEEVQQCIGRAINLNSHEQLCALLFDQLALPVTQTTSSGNPSTKIDVLERIIDHHAVVTPVVRYLRAEELRRYSRGLKGTVDVSTMRIRTNLDPLGAATGRYSSSHPNLQNLSTEMRHVVVAPPGYMLLELDYSQAELGVLAFLSGEQRLRAAFADRTADLHRQTAATVMGIDVEEVTDQQRQIGKTINFAIIYGQTEHGLAETLQVPLKRAQKLIETYFHAHPQVAHWITQIHELASVAGCVQTFYGRRRWLPDITSADESRAAKARRQAVNTVIQGTAAEILKMALIRLHRELPADVRMVLTVHDSVLLEVPIDRVAEVQQQVISVMENPPPDFTVPLWVEASIGRTWAECKTNGATTHDEAHVTALGAAAPTPPGGTHSRPTATAQ